jgi:hypothetical protein
MTFEELTFRIDKEIAEKKLHEKYIWFDININVSGISEKIISYYRERGYTIELAPCRSCQGQLADVTITWNRGL